MALNFPSSPTNGQIYTDDNNISWQFDGVKWNVASSTSYNLYNGVKAGLTTNFAATSTLTAVSWDNIFINIGDYYSAGTPSKILIQTTGFYRINFSATTGSSGSTYTIQVKKNGTFTLSSTTITINQYINYDEIMELSAGDYIEVYVSETLSSGSLLSSTTMEVTRAGLSAGSAAQVFSGARAKIDATYSTSAVATAVSWESVDFNQNANSAGAQYWSISNSSRLTVGTNSYYRLKAVVLTNIYDSYIITLRKNGTTTLTTISVGSLNTVQLDEIYQLNIGDYVELVVNDTGGTGGLLVGTYLEILRLGNV